MVKKLVNLSWTLKVSVALPSIYCDVELRSQLSVNKSGKYFNYVQGKNVNYHIFYK